ncbi:MAG: hypothetical protein KatS3mg087_0965 [Patescibacteria group bacterium]|nr:MAG: hypothetical protein KatS3mg087_0965 [Patescibacteria group bacterium]
MKSSIVSTSIILFAYSQLFASPLNLGSDFNFVSYDHFRTYSTHPYLWDSSLNNGFGGYILFTLLFQPYSQIARLWTYLTSDPALLHKLIFLLPTILLGFASSTYAARHFFLSLTSRALFILLYLTNPYVILLISGGQVGVAMAYAFLPAFFTAWYQLGLRIHHHRHITNLRIVLTTLTVPLFLTLDARLFLLGILLVIPIYLYLFYQHRRHLAPIFRISLRLALLSATFTLLLHAHWLLPAFYLEPVRLPQGYSTSFAVEYFSFTRFAHAFSWSHPNYPQNIFGKVNEIHPATLVFPLIAFLAIRLRPQKLVIYFSLVAILASFLAKGTNEPFGQVYAWLFTALPGFNLFRDSTKFYVLISLAYAYLISLSLGTILHQLAHQNLTTSLARLQPILTRHLSPTVKISRYRSRVKLKGSKFPTLYAHLQRLASHSQPTLTLLSRIPIGLLLFTATLLLISFAWWPTFSQQIQGTLAYRTYPQSYQELQSILESDPEFGRVLWLPTRELYGYTSLTHPAVNFDLLTRTPTCHPQFCQELPRYPADYIFTTTDLASETELLLQKLQQPNLEAIFQELSIKYLVLVPDYDGNIYTYDYKPHPAQYSQYRIFLDQHPNLRQVYAADDLVLYQTTNPTAFITDRLSGQPLSYQKINPTHYQIPWSGGVGEIHVSQSYDPRWQLNSGENTIQPEITDNATMYFRLNTDPATYNLIYSGQQYADLGWSISQLALSAVLLYLFSIYLSARRKSAI